jgi:hypothetical protein
MVFRNALSEHIETCPEAIHPCKASKYGCTAKFKRADLSVHERTCPLITMGPYIEAQNSRIDALDMALRQVRQRNEILEDGIANIRSTLVETARFIPNNSEGRHSPSRRHGRSRSRSTSQTGGSDSGIGRSSNLSSTTATTYLLSLHESLREEVSQLTHAITDLDARASMAIMNENLRIKEDMAHTNAAVNSIRMQIHWLMNPRVHQGLRPGSGPSAGSAAGDSRTGAAGLRSASSGPSSSMGPRRLSDGGREGTKL